MDKSKYAVRIDNIYFLDRIGASLRWATEDIAREELPADIKRLLNRLDRLEARARAKGRSPADEFGALNDLASASNRQSAQVITPF